MAVRSNQSLETGLNQLGQLSDEDLAVIYAEVSGIPLWEPDLEPSELDGEDFGVGSEFLRKVRVVPLRLEDGRLVCAVCDPFDEEINNATFYRIGTSCSTISSS